MTEIKRVCSEIKLLLSAYQDNELEEKAKAEVHSHLMDCGNCQEEFQKLENLYARLKGLKEIEPVPNFTPLVMDKIRLKEQEKSRWFALPSLVYSFVFAVFLIIGFWFTTITTSLDESMKQQEEIYISNLLVESQNLSLINIQDQTIAMLYTNNHLINGKLTNEK